MNKNILNKLPRFTIKQNRFLNSVYKYLFKIFKIIFLAFFTVVCLAIALLFNEPRNITSLNIYVKSKLTKVESNIKYMDFSGANLFLDNKLNLVYDMKKFKIKFANNHVLVLPHVICRISLARFLMLRFVFNSVTIEDLSIKLKAMPDINSFRTSGEFSLHKLHPYLDYIITKSVPLDKFIVNKSAVIVKQSGVIKLDYLVFDLGKFSRKNKFLNVYGAIGTNSKNSTILLKNRCLLNKAKAIECSSDIQNINIKTLMPFGKNYQYIRPYINNIDTNLHGTASLKLTNYTHLENLEFRLDTKPGFFNLKKFFSKKIYFRNLQIFGRVKNNFNHIKLDIRNTKFLFKEYKKPTNFSLSLLKSSASPTNKNIVLRIEVLNAPINKLDTLWPVFLDQKDIRPWVIGHFKDGLITKAYANMHYKLQDSQYNLHTIKSEVNFDDTRLAYVDFLPALKINAAKAVFTKHGMQIYVKQGVHDNTTISDALVQSDFDANITTLDIVAKSLGPVHELFYYVDNTNKLKVKNIVNNFFNGSSEGLIHVRVPLLDVINLEDVAIEVNSHITKNNTFIFNKDSDIYINIKKPADSSIFKGNIDLTNANIYFPIIKLDKKKNLATILDFDLDTQDADKLIINNIHTKPDNYIKILNGTSELDKGSIRTLTLKGIEYPENHYDLSFTAFDNQNLYIVGEEIALPNNFKNHLTIFNKAYNFKDVSNLEVGIIAKKFNFGNKSIFNNINSFLSVENSVIQALDIKGFFGDKETIMLNYNGADHNGVRANISDIGALLNKLDFTNKILAKQLTFIGNYEPNKAAIDGNLILKDGLTLLTDNNIQKNTIVRSVLENERIPKNVKKSLLEKNTVKFSKIEANLIINKTTIEIEELLARGNMLSIDLTATGQYNFKTGETNLAGLIVPAGRINRLFFIDRIPILNTLILGGKNGALFALEYEFIKKDFASDARFSIDGFSLLKPGVLRSLFNKL